jgi:hypothetical protein
MELQIFEKAARDCGFGAELVGVSHGVPPLSDGDW